MIKISVLTKVSFFLMILIFLSCVQKPKEYAIIETEEGRIVLKFFPDVAPKHVESFKILAREGYFNGTSFHRIVPGFVIQGGDPNSKDGDRYNDGLGGRAGKYYGIGEKDNPDTWMLPAEFNDRPHRRGTLSMARGPQENSAGSQFFICVGDQPQLDNKYTVFGEVVEGIETVERIANTRTPRRLNPNYERPDGYNPVFGMFMDVTVGTAEELKLDLSI
ncbi:MAG TPA: peptidylprolyl isomerase [Candidatus Marinimicrobia bacterium]|nr:peptidylprolyl isomerase [Candidatus Neomarinimicrobiota bacterium]HIO55520.1 peptidylprolyl isomerase [Candidatus Neomarinimicrobiota bacterium]